MKDAKAALELYQEFVGNEKFYKTLGSMKAENFLVAMVRFHRSHIYYIGLREASKLYNPLAAELYCGNYHTRPKNSLRWCEFMKKNDYCESGKMI